MRTWWIVDFAVPADHRVKIKENENRDKYLNIARELKKKLWNMKVTMTSCNWCAWKDHLGPGKGRG